MSRWDEWRYHCGAMKKKQAEQGINPCTECRHCVYYGLYDPDLDPTGDCLGADDICDRYIDEREDYN